MKHNVKPKTRKSHSYTLHFAVSGFSPLLLDLIFNNDSYGAVEYRVLYENDITRAYLTETGNRQSHELSKKLFRDDFFGRLLNDSELLDKKLKEHEVPRLNGRNAVSEWKKYVELMDEFCRLYIFYEQPFQQALEEIILSQISEKDLINYLSGLDKGSINKLDMDIRGRKALDKLLELGKMKLRLHTSMSDLTSDKFIGYVAKKSGISMSLIKCLTADEFADAIEGKAFDVNVAEERLAGCALVKRNNAWHFDAGKKYLRWKNRIEKNQRSEISGNVAYPGKVEGRVVVHLSWTDTTEIEEGDVLVAGMTNPQMIPYIKKAGAIVTDEGGITCHAAIIARELRKPCITGTKNATQLLKNGDLVEVDAYKGVVRILE
jgi:phosphohistidine swiveling domain-containing protein